MEFLSQIGLDLIVINTKLNKNSFYNPPGVSERDQDFNFKQ